MTQVLPERTFSRNPCVFLRDESQGPDTNWTAIFGGTAIGSDRREYFNRLQNIGRVRTFESPMGLTSGSLLSESMEQESTPAYLQLQAECSWEAVQHLFVHSQLQTYAAALQGESSRPIQVRLLVPYRYLTTASNPGAGKPLSGSFFRIKGLVQSRWDAQIRKLEALAPGWNGYSAPPPTQAAIQAAKRYLQIAAEQDFDPYRVEASVIGGVGITYRSRERKVYIEFYNNEKVHCLFSERATRMETTAVNPNADGYRDLIARAKGYLDG